MATRRLTIKAPVYDNASTISVSLNGATYTVSLPTVMTANTLYMIYFTNTGLVISQNVNSVGPAGYTSWHLVGAFYSNGNATIGFGSFVTIDGPPTTQIPVQQNTARLTADNGQQVTFNEVNTMSWWREGSKIQQVWNFFGAANQNGAGIYYLWPVPTNLTLAQVEGQRIDTSNLGHRTQHVGEADSINNNLGNGYQFVMFVYSTVWYAAYASVHNSNVFNFSPTNFTLTTGFQDCKGKVTGVLVNGWSDTPLKDL